MIDPKTFDALTPPQAARAVVALVIYHALLQRDDASLATMDTAFDCAEAFLARAAQP